MNGFNNELITTSLVTNNLTDDDIYIVHKYEFLKFLLQLKKTVISTVKITKLGIQILNTNRSIQLIRQELILKIWVTHWICIQLLFHSKN
jgi:hypothetical protein